MLKSRPSLKLRAALIFVSIYAAIFLAGVVLSSFASLSSSGERHHAGPRVALAFAANEMRLASDGISFPNGSSFAALASRNAALWLLVDDGERRFSFGPVPEAVDPLLNPHVRVLEQGVFHVPGISRPLSDAAVERRGDVLLAAGGVDPDTIRLSESFRFFLQEGLFTALLALGLLGLLVMLLALPLLTRALKPVIADAASIRPEEPFRRIREARVPRELLPLVRGFNSALDRLSGELVRRRRFIVDAAHELRTPLAIAALQVESLEDGERKEDLQRTMARMTHLVAQMLDVERLSLVGLPETRVDLAAVARDVVADMAPLANGSGYELSLETPSDPVFVKGDPHAVSRAIENLVGNAIAHSAGKGQINVVVSASRTLDVIDEGPGVPPAILPHLFEPFCRGRSDSEGCGLGLHLTREIMSVHGGEAILLPTERSAAFRLRFPPEGGCT